MTLEEISQKYPNRDAAFPSNLEKPNKEDLNEIQTKYSCIFPKSFILFQLDYCKKIPMGDFSFDGFGWANKNLEPYLSLEEIVKDYQELGLPNYLTPFRTDNEVFWCFDTRFPDINNEFPVVIWNDSENGIEKDSHFKWKNFIDWLDKTMEEE